MKKIIKWGLIGFIGLVVLGAVLGSSDSSSNKDIENDSDQKQEKVKVEVIEVVAFEFIAEFDKNQLAAEERYKDKWVKMTAYVDNISEDIMGTPFLILQPVSDEYYFGTSVQCFFEEKSKLTSLENGQKVTIQGKVSSQLMNVLIKECVVVGE